MQLSEVLDRLRTATSLASRICSISGVPSASVGILHNGDVIHTDNIGFSNVASKKKPTSDTMYGIGSLTKGFTAAGVAALLGEHDTADWFTPLREIVPEFKLKNHEIQGLVSTADFLAHKTGLLGDMSIATQGDMEILLPWGDTLSAVADLEHVAAFRQEWMYNNWGYSVAGKVIERLSGKPFYDYIQEVVLDPLKLTNTSMKPLINESTDFADAYTALEDASFHLLPRAFPFIDSIFKSAGGMFSTVNDMLKYAKAILEAESNPDSSPLKHIRMLLSNQIPLDTPSRDYRFYGMGWIRTQLPGVVGLQGDNAELFDMKELPVLGNDSPTIMAYYHQGAGLGYYSAIFLFPETKSAVVVLTNSMPLNDAADWIAQLYVSKLFGFPNTANYVKLAEESRRRKLANVAQIQIEFEKIRMDNPGIQQPLHSYIGQYYNAVGNFFIDIRDHANKSDCLKLSFQGRDTQIYELRHLHRNTFEWAVDYNESARRARFSIWDPAYFQIDFEVEANGTASSLTWAKDTVVRPAGMKLVRERRKMFHQNGIPLKHPSGQSVLVPDL